MILHSGESFHSHYFLGVEKQLSRFLFPFSSLIIVYSPLVSFYLGPDKNSLSSIITPQGVETDSKERKENKHRTHDLMMKITKNTGCRKRNILAEA